ncbi:hypothetical protein DIPPA_12156 [Diplonema papillatum]|nr:hypothetical protein DIPPA_12156 [Diplonema papillatum]
MDDELRYDTDGSVYTKAQFVAFYGGTEEWDRSHPVGHDSPAGSDTEVVPEPAAPSKETLSKLAHSEPAAFSFSSSPKGFNFGGGGGGTGTLSFSTGPAKDTPTGFSWASPSTGGGTAKYTFPTAQSSPLQSVSDVAGLFSKKAEGDGAPANTKSSDATPPPALEEYKPPEPGPNDQWACSVCGQVKPMSGAHLATKTEVNSQCISKKCHFKKRTFVRKVAGSEKANPDASKAKVEPTQPPEVKPTPPPEMKPAEAVKPLFPSLGSSTGSAPGGVSFASLSMKEKEGAAPSSTPLDSTFKSAVSDGSTPASFFQLAKSAASAASATVKSSPRNPFEMSTTPAFSSTFTPPSAVTGGLFSNISTNLSATTPAAPAAAAAAPAAAAASGKDEWVCTKCGAGKNIAGDHLKDKTEVNSQCNSKICCFKKKIFVRKQPGAAPASATTPAPVLSGLAATPAKAATPAPVFSGFATTPTPAAATTPAPVFAGFAATPTPTTATTPAPVLSGFAATPSPASASTPAPLFSGFAAAPTPVKAATPAATPEKAPAAATSAFPAPGRMTFAEALQSHKLTSNPGGFSFGTRMGSFPPSTFAPPGNIYRGGSGGETTVACVKNNGSQRVVLETSCSTPYIFFRRGLASLR